ncbi:MAG: RNA polymerase sigma-70 factor (ECF subfamily) [Paracoccaceae bacterium]|jgi:RNA polymerase sigma-70 factor (ECF subfamily)
METATRQIQQQQLLAQMGWVRGLARRLVTDPGLADDIAQDAWLAAHSAPPAHVESDGHLRAWLAVVVRNLVGKSGRSKSRRRGREERAARPEAIESSAELVAKGAMHRDLTNCVMALDEPYRSTLLLRYFEGLSTDEVARRQQITPAAARKRLSRATDKLRANLDAEHDGDRSAWTMALIPLIQTGPTAKVAAGMSAWVLLGNTAMSTKFVALLIAAALAILFTLTRGSAPDVPMDVNLSQTEEGAVTRVETSVERQEPSASTRLSVAATGPYVVVLDHGGEPLVDALVAFLVGAELKGSTRTDTAGRAELPGVSEGFFALIAPRGQVPRRFAVTSTSEVQVLRLARAASLSGEVIGVDAPGALELALSFDRPVAVLADLGGQVRRLLAEEGIQPDELMVRPDASGGFHFGGLASDWSGALLAPHGTRIAESPSHGAVFEGRELLLLDPVVGLTLPLERVVALRGRVVDEAAGLPVADLLVSGRLEVEGSRAQSVPQVTTDRGGCFRLALPMGVDTRVPWRLRLRADDAVAGGATWSFENGTLASSGDLGDLVIDLGGVATILVQATDGKPIEGAVGTLVEERVHSLPTDGSGGATIRGVRSTPAALVVTAPGYAVAETSVEPGLQQIVTLEASRSMHISVTRPDGEGVDDLHVQILGEERVWEGTGPLSWMDVEVTARQAKRSRRVLEQPRAFDRDGSLEVGPLRGGVRLDVVLLGPSGEHLESRLVVTPRDPGRSKVAFVAPSSGFRFSGTVRAIDGRGLPRAKVHIEASGMSIQVMTGADGGFSVGPFHAEVEGVYIEVSRPGFALRQFRDVRFDEHSALLEVALERARRVEVELVDTLGRRVVVPYLTARLVNDGVYVAFKADDGVYDFRAIPFRAGEIVMEVAGAETTSPIDGTQTRLTMEVPAMGTIEVRLAAGAEFAKGARVNVIWRRVVDGVAGEQQSKLLVTPGRSPRPLEIDLPPGRYLLQLEERVLSRRSVEKIGEVHTIDIAAGERHSLVLP